MTIYERAAYLQAQFCKDAIEELANSSMTQAFAPAVVQWAKETLHEAVHVYRKAVATDAAFEEVDDDD